MCGRFALVEGPRDLGRLYAVLAKMEDFPPRYNIAPTQPVLAVWQETGRRVARLVRWGLVPGWVKDPREFPLLINARAETMTEKPAFRDSVRNQRCVVPVSGYYEWRTGPGGSKVPYYIARADGEPMSLAGLLSSWAGPNGEEVDTVALVTTAANDALSAIHHRMPAILEGESVEDWLDTAGVEARRARELARPLGEGCLIFHPVSHRVNSGRNDGPELIEPVAETPPESPGKPARARGKAAGQLDLF